jgi:asparagine synthetase B (glutamine-hydrolysing)
LVGEYAFAAWNPAQRVLIAARDPLASRPLFWSWDTRRLVVASKARVVTDLSRSGRVPDEGALAELLCERPSTVTATVWKGVERLPSGVALVFDARARRIRTVAFWQPVHGPPPDCADEALREGVRRAVRRRARTGETVACELSGGLDSTTVLGVGQALGIELRPYSSVFPGLACDETEFIAASLAWYDLKGVLLEAPPPTLDERRRCVQEHGLIGDYVLGGEGPRRAAAADGCDAILTGDFGDEVLGGSTIHARADALHRPDPLALWRVMAQPNRRRLTALAYRDHLRWRLGRQVRRRWQAPPPMWVSPALARRTALQDRFADAERRPPAGPPSFRWMAWVLTGWWTQSRSDRYRAERRTSISAGRP